MKEDQVTNAQQLKDALHESEAERVAADLDLWPAIRGRLRARVCPLHGRRLPASRLGWAVMGLGLLLALGTAAYAVAPILSRAFRMEPGSQGIDLAHLGQEINLRQTVDGLTVTLRRAYADANRIVLGYTVTGPEGRDLNNFDSDMTLTDQDGTVFPPHGLFGAGIVTGGYVASFDSAVLKEAPTALHLHLVMHVSGLPCDAFGPTGTTPTPLAAMEGEASQAGTVVILTPLPAGAEVEAGPFTFDLSVPLIPGRIMDTPQTVEAAGIAMTLERVVVTSSETRAILRFDPPVGGEGEATRRWVPIVALQVNDGLRGGQSFAGAVGERDGAYACSVLAPLQGHRGEWTLDVSELVGFDETGSAQDVRMAGPWVFRFRVP